MAHPQCIFSIGDILQRNCLLCADEEKERLMELKWPHDYIGKQAYCVKVNLISDPLTVNKSYTVYDISSDDNGDTLVKVNNDQDSKVWYIASKFVPNNSNCTCPQCKANQPVLVEEKQYYRRNGVNIKVTSPEHLAALIAEDQAETDKAMLDLVRSMQEKEDLALDHKYPLSGLKQQIEATSYQGHVSMTQVPRTPYCCPVCYGRGHVAAGFYASTGQSWTSSNVMPETCKSCSGTGIVWG